MNPQDTHCYEDIINREHPKSDRHPPMKLSDRAAQFMPFSALTGYEQAIEETARLTQEEVELTEDTKWQLNEKLRILQENVNSSIPVTLTYFVPDARKSGGAYVTATGVVKRMDVYQQAVILQDDTIIYLEQIRKIESDLF